MEAAKLHSILNYYPAIVLVIGTIMLAIGIAGRHERIRRFSLKLMILSALVTFPAFVSGEISGAAATKIHTGSHADALSDHKTTARMSFWLTQAAGSLSLVVLIAYRRRGELPSWGVWTAMALSLAACLAIIYTTHLGRQVKWAGAMASIEYQKEKQQWHA